MKEHKKSRNPARPVLLLLLWLVSLGIFTTVLLRGAQITVFNPKGHIAQEQLKLLLFTAAVLFGIAIPTLAVLYFFAWKYRDTGPNDKKDKHIAKAQYGKLFVFSIWTIPCVVMVPLSVVMWSATHRLEPQKALASGTQPLRVQVVAMRWKWLFIYPEQHIATVNYVQIPTDTPVEFDLTADDAPMSSFWIPNLAGQLYAMTGHVNRLNLIADTPGDYPGGSAEINGAGFAGMKFMARATTRDKFDQWAKFAAQSTNDLDSAGYQELLKPMEDNPITYYANVNPNLYGTVVQKYMASHGGHAEHK